MRRYGTHGLVEVCVRVKNQEGSSQRVCFAEGLNIEPPLEIQQLVVKTVVPLEPEYLCEGIGSI